MKFISTSQLTRYAKTIILTISMFGIIHAEQPAPSTTQKHTKQNSPETIIDGYKNQDTESDIKTAISLAELQEILIRLNEDLEDRIDALEHDNKHEIANMLRTKQQVIKEKLMQLGNLDEELLEVYLNQTKKKKDQTIWWIVGGVVVALTATTLVMASYDPDHGWSKPSFITLKSNFNRIIKKIQNLWNSDGTPTPAPQVSVPTNDSQQTTPTITTPSDPVITIDDDSNQQTHVTRKSSRRKKQQVTTSDAPPQKTTTVTQPPMQSKTKKQQSKKRRTEKPATLDPVIPEQPVNNNATAPQQPIPVAVPPVVAPLVVVPPVVPPVQQPIPVAQVVPNNPPVITPPPTIQTKQSSWHWYNPWSWGRK